jgi:hypothetical protein
MRPAPAWRADRVRDRRWVSPGQEGKSLAAGASWRGGRSDFLHQAGKSTDVIPTAASAEQLDAIPKAAVATEEQISRTREIGKRLRRLDPTLDVIGYQALTNVLDAAALIKHSPGTMGRWGPT